MAENTQQPEAKSEFTGGLLGLIGINIVCFFATVLTLGLLYPWAHCYKQRWMTNHTKINGNGMVFDGKAMQLFGSYIKWALLCIITLFIYAFWVPVKMEAWTTSHTKAVGADPAAESTFDGGAGGYLGITIVNFFARILTLGLLTPWAICRLNRWCAKHTIISGVQLSFDGLTMQLFGNYIKWYLLTIITFGIYGFWRRINMIKWQTKHWVIAG